jgi:hypothetical protein
VEVFDGHRDCANFGFYLVALAKRMVIAHQSLRERFAPLFQFFDVLSNRALHQVNTGENLEVGENFKMRLTPQVQSYI